MLKVVYLFLLFLGLSVMAQAQTQKKYQTTKGDSYNYRSQYNAKPSKKEVSHEAEKPQYSDPAYFGHKSKPKKRKPGKKKFCKECQIVH